MSAPSPHPFDFFDRLVWLDGRPLMSTIEPYRRAIFEVISARRVRLNVEVENLLMNAIIPPAAGEKAQTMVTIDPDNRQGALKQIGGSQSDDWNNLLANQTVQTLWLKNQTRKHATVNMVQLSTH